MRRHWINLTCLLLVACSGASRAPEAPGRTALDVPLVWPAAPAAARIRFEYTFSGPEELGIRPGGLRKVWDALAGSRNFGMVRPYAIAVRQNKVLVGDPGARVVHVFDMLRGSYMKIDRAGDRGFESPVGVALGDQRIYVADSAAGRVYVFNDKGRLINSLGPLQRPTGLVFDPASGRLYVAETLGHRIIVLDSDGVEQFAFGSRGTADGQFNYPSHISLEGDHLLVNDNMNFRIQVFETTGTHVATFGEHGDGSGHFSQPKGVAADARGNVYVAGATIDRVQIFSAEGEFLLAFGGEGTAPGRFVMPTGVAIDGKEIYVADSYNRRIQVFSYVGEN